MLKHIFYIVLIVVSLVLFDRYKFLVKLKLNFYLIKKIFKNFSSQDDLNKEKRIFNFLKLLIINSTFQILILMLPVIFLLFLSFLIPNFLSLLISLEGLIEFLLVIFLYLKIKNNAKL